MDQQPPVANQTPNQTEPPFVTKTLGQSAQPPANQLLSSAPKQGGLAGFYRDNRWYIWAIVVGLVVISVLSYFAFRKAPATAPKEANVNISVDVPGAAPAGGQAVYKIKVENNDSQKLVALSLELNYADGMTYVSSSPNAQNLSGTQFTVPDLTPGQNAVIVVKAQVAGNVNDTKDLNLKLHYKYSNFNSEFVKQQSASIRLTASDVVLDVNGPASTNNAQIVVYTVRYQNNSQNTITGARVQLNYPDGFAFATAEPQPDSGGNIWNVDSLAPGASGSISIQGSFASANPGESKTVSADFLILGQDGQYFIQNSGQFTTSLASLPLLVSQEVANLNGGNVVKPGDNLSFNIKYQNNSSVVANGVNIILTLNSKALDLSTIQSEGGQVSNNTILWNASSVANLGSLNPSDNGQLQFSVKIKNPATRDSSKNLTVVSDIKIKSNEYDAYFPGNELTLKIAGPVSLTTALNYQSGQLPPQVGKQTLYTAVLTLTNTTDDFTGGVLTAFIPLGAGGFVAGSVNSSESGNVQFDPSTNKLTWQVGPMPAHSGQFSAAKTLQFGVRLLPSSSQVGDHPTLIKDIQFTATDSFTNQQVSVKADDLTTYSASGNAGQSGTVQQ